MSIKHEVPYDSQMNRTKDRVLVRGNLTPLHAFTFASICGIAGVGALYFLVNPLTAALGASTLFLYTMIYTPMKRLSALNTWVGSIVGNKIKLLEEFSLKYVDYF